MFNKQMAESLDREDHKQQQNRLEPDTDANANLIEGDGPESVNINVNTSQFGGDDAQEDFKEDLEETKETVSPLVAGNEDL